MARKNTTCPRCGSKNTVKIAYGMPTYEMEEKAERGEVVLGGCCIFMEGPTMHCKDCEYDWRRCDGLSFFDHMISLEASVGGFFGSSYYVKIDWENGTISSDEYFGEISIPEVRETKKLTEEVWNKLVKALIHFDVEYWHARYDDVTILDGTSWEVIITLSSGEMIIKSGSNAYPGTWKQFCRLISGVSGRGFK